MATITAIFNAQDNLSKAMANAGNAGSKTTGIMQKLGKIGSVAMKGIIAAVTAAGTALLAFGKKAISTGMTFETSMSQVMATMGVNTATAEGQAAYDKLSAAAEKMGAETAFTASQAADALNYLALAGYEVEDACAALPTVLHLAGAGGMELSRASDMITDSMAALGLTVNQTNLDRFADQMAKTASTTNTSVSQLGDAITTVGANAANLRNGTTELNTQLGIMANVGIKGSEAGTKFRNILQSLGKAAVPTSQVAKELKKLGVTVYDTDGKMRDTGAIFDDLRGSMSGWDQSDIDATMSKIFNKADLAAAKALLAGAGDEYDRIFNIIENSGGAAAEMYETMLDNLKGDVDIFNSATEALYLTLYKNVNGTLRNLVQTGTSYMNRLNDAFKAGGFEGLVTELGNVLGDATGVIMSYAPKLVQAGTGIVMAFVESIGDNADTIAEAAADIAIELGSAIVKIAPKMVQAFGKVLSAVGKAALSAIPKLFKSIPDSIYNAIGLDKSKAMPKIYAFAGFMRSAITKLFSGDIFGSVDSVGRAFNIDTGTLDKVKGILTSIGSALSKVWGFAQKAAAAIGGFLGKFASIGGVEATIAGLVAGFAALKAINIGKSFMNMAKGVKKAGGAMKAIGKVLTANKFLLIAAAIAAVVAGIVLLVKNWDKVKKAIGSGIDKVFGAGTFDKLSQSMSKVGEGFKKIGGWAKDSWGKMKSAFGEGYKSGGLFGGISAAFGSLKESLKSVDWSGIWDGIKDTTLELWGKLKTAVSTSVALVKLWFLSIDWGGIWTSIKNTASSLWTKLKTAATKAKDKVVEWFSTVDWVGIWNNITSTASDLWEKMKSAAVLAWLRVRLWFQTIDWTGIWNKITSTASDLWEKMKSVASGAKDKVVEWFGTVDWGAIWNTISATFVSLWEKLKSVASVAVSLVKVWFMTVNWSGIWDGIKDTAASLWENVKSALEDASGEGGVIGALSSGLSSAMETAESITSEVTSAIETLQSNGTIGEIWNSVKSIVESIWEIVSKIVSAFSGEIGDAALEASGLSNGIVAGVQLIADAVDLMADGLQWLSDVIGKLDEAGALVPLLEGVGAAIATYFTASAIMNVANFFKAFSAGQAIFAALNPHILAIAAAVAGLVALISWAHGQVKREDKTWGDYKEFDLQEIEMRLDTTVYPDVTNASQAMQAIESQIAQMVERGTFGEDVGAKLSEMLSQYVTPDGFNFEAWYESGRSAALDLLNGISEGMETSSDIPNPADEILQTMNQTFESATGQSIDFSSMYSGVDTAADKAATDALATLNNITNELATTDLSAAGGEAGAGYMEGLANADPSSAASTITTNAENAVRAAQQSGSPAAAYMPIGAEAAQGYGMGLQQEDVSSYAEGFATAAMAAVSAATQAEAAALTLEAEGSTVIQTFSAGMTAASPVALAVIKVLGVAIRAVAQSVNLTSQGANMLRTLTSGMNSGRSAAVASARSTGSGIRSAFSSINLYSVGTNIVAGLRNGMQSMFNSLLATARSMASKLKSTIQSGMQVHSPSRFTDWIGRMTGQGWIDGMEGMTKKVTAAAAAMALGVSSAFAPIAVAAPSFDTPQAVTMDYPSVTAPQPIDFSPYQTIGQSDSDFSSSTNERRIVIDLKGGGKIEVTGLTREKAIELIYEQLKPQLSAILAEEIFEGGDSVYEF